MINIIVVDLQRLISRLLIDDYLKQEFIDQHPSSTTAYLRPGVNAVQLTSSTPERADSHQKIHIQLTIRIEQTTPIDVNKSKQRTHEQINEHCLNELKGELKEIFTSHSYSTIISDRTIDELVRLMPYVFCCSTTSADKCAAF
jgi:hypothetical protein